jgi:hypothetical protein
MKKPILITFVFFFSFIVAASSPLNDTITQDVRKPLRISGKQIYTENILHTESEVLMLLSISPDFVAQYQKGKSLRRTGTGLLLGGIATITGGVAVAVVGTINSPWVEVNGYGSGYIDYNGTYYLGLIIASLGELMVDGAVVCKIVGKGYIRKSIANYNQAIKTSGYVPGSLSYQLGVLDNGMVGLKVTF